MRALAAQLAGSVPGFAGALAQHDKKAMSSWPLKERFQRLIVEPAQASAKAFKQTKMAVVVDALDECSEVDKFTVELKRAWTQMPPNLVLVVTGRPNDDIVKHTDDSWAPHKLVAEDADNKRDVRETLVRVLGRLGVPADH